MKLLARISDPVDQIGLHETVDVLVLVCDREASALHVMEDPSKFRSDQSGFLMRNDPLSAKHLRMRDAALYVFSV